jgi:hypothetical protein
MAQPAVRRKYETFSKIEAVTFGKSSNNYAAAQEFDKTENIVQDWWKNEDLLKIRITFFNNQKPRYLMQFWWR